MPQETPAPLSGIQSPTIQVNPPTDCPSCLLHSIELRTFPSLRSHDSAHDCCSHGLELRYVLCAKVVHVFFCWPHILPKNTEESVKGLRV